MELRYWRITGFPEDEWKKVGRNSPCPCGSNRKFKKCCLANKKPRQMAAVIDFGKPAKINEIIFDRYKKRFHFISDYGEIKPSSVTFETKYPRNDSEKIINRNHIPSEHITLEPNDQFTYYDKVFAVDTNTHLIGEEVISVTCVVLCEVSDALTFGGSLVRYMPVNCIEFRNPQHDPEKTGLRLFIRGVMANPNFNNDMKICVITDHDLDSHTQYNKRNLPLIGDFYLPKSFTLAYGSADVGKKEYLPNILMSVAHKSSYDLLKCIAADDEYGNASHIPIETATYTYYRVWIHDDSVDS